MMHYLYVCHKAVSQRYDDAEYHVVVMHQQLVNTVYLWGNKCTFLLHFYLSVMLFHHHEKG